MAAAKASNLVSLLLFLMGLNKFTELDLRQTTLYSVLVTDCPYGRAGLPFIPLPLLFRAPPSPQSLPPGLADEGINWSPSMPFLPFMR